MNGMLKELNWIGKATKHKSDADVSITLGHRSNGKEIVSIIVRNEMFKPFLGDYSLRYDEFYELYYIEK